MPRCFAFAISVALAVTSAAPGAVAQPALELEWQAPPDCPERADVLREAERLLANTTVRSSLRASGKIEPSAGRFVLELSTELGETRGFRRLEASSCGDLLEPAAVVIALAIDPDLALPDPTATGEQPAPPENVAALPPIEEPVATPTPATRAAPEPQPDSVRDRAVDRPEREASRFHARAGAGVAIDVGTLPRPAIGAALVLAAGLDRFELEARGAIYASQTEHVSGDASGELTLASLGAAACYRLLDVVSLSACAGGEGGRLRGRGEGVTDPGSAAIWLLSAFAGVRAAQPVAGPLRLFARLEGVVAINQPRFVLENVGIVHEPRRVGARGALGAEVTFP